MGRQLSMLCAAAVIVCMAAPFNVARAQSPAQRDPGRSGASPSRIPQTPSDLGAYKRRGPEVRRLPGGPKVAADETEHALKGALYNVYTYFMEHPNVFYAIEDAAVPNLDDEWVYLPTAARAKMQTRLVSVHQQMRSRAQVAEPDLRNALGQKYGFAPYQLRQLLRDGKLWSDHQVTLLRMQGLDDNAFLIDYDVEAEFDKGPDSERVTYEFRNIQVRRVNGNWVLPFEALLLNHPMDNYLTVTRGSSLTVTREGLFGALGGFFSFLPFF